jgi:exodeoxyribonuclease V beta subunit
MITRAEPVPFELRGPLPTGVTVLEASAGTGKTYTIAALAARYVAEGIPLERLLLVTFTRMATGELRERVRERLVYVERELSRTLAGAPATGEDPIVELLAAGTPEEVRLRRDRLVTALSDFDAATIATTHGFCQEVLGGLGIAADLEPGVTFVEDLSDLVDEVVDDLYVGRAFRGESTPFGRAQAGEIARSAVDNPAATIAPAAGDAAVIRRRLAIGARLELESRKRRMSVMGYDDLLTRLDEALKDDPGGVTAQRLRARYDVVLVDEFQDTDSVQWDIMRRAFAATGGTLVLIADPKQAIYGFRGADVYAYLEAAQEAARRATLEVNWRSDQDLIDAYDALFAGAKLGHEGIVYRHVRAADAHRSRRLHDAPHGAPLRIRVVPRDGLTVTRTGCASNRSAREHIARDLAADVVALLSSGAEVTLPGARPRRERLRPAHVAVLVQTNRTAAQIREALEHVDVPAVINGAGSVFATDTAREWLRLLEGLERPASTTRAHTAALTCFLGWPAERSATADEEEWEEVHRRLYEWARVLRVKGVASLLETVTLTEGLPERLLQEVDGERRLTDLRHVGQLLHAAASGEQLGTTALTGWLRKRIVEAADDTADEERSRRLESDEEAVQVLTIHRSKGLEFPVVYLPFLWEPGYIPSGAHPVFFHDPAAGDERTIDVSLEGPDFDRHQRQHVLEERGEDLRLAYVALTRARHQAVVWWAGSWDSRNSPLGRLVFSRDADGNVPADGGSTPSDAAAFERFRELAAQAPDRITVERSVLASVPASWSPPLPSLHELGHAEFGRSLDLRWRRTSYSDITAGSYDAQVASEPEEPAIADEPAEHLPIPPSPAPAGRAAADDPALAQPSLLAAMPVGVRVGTLIHRVMQECDFAADDLDAELDDGLAAARAWRAVEIGDPAVVRAGLRATIETPLGPILGGLRLRDVGVADRLDELEFELPLAGGDAPTGSLALALIAQVLRDHLPADDPFAAYAARLDDPALRHTVRGYLTGSLDLVVRIAGPHGPRFAVLDYKTNWLAGPDEELTVWHHRRSALTAQMLRHHYALQALLYAVALHRYLRWRLAEYDPDRHLAGVLYLFVRGMIGPDTPVVAGTPCGVFGWRPSRAVIEALSDALDHGAPA